MKEFLIHAGRRICIAMLMFFVLVLASCGMPEDEVLVSLGKYTNRVFFTSGGFQDYTDYAKYSYDSPQISENPYFEIIRKEDFAEIHTHLDDFEKWIEIIKNSEPSSEIVENYDFRREIIDEEDYFHIISEEHTWSDGTTSLVRYNIYFFDTQTHVLYYFHNNI